MNVFELNSQQGTEPALAGDRGEGRPDGPDVRTSPRRRTTSCPKTAPLRAFLAELLADRPVATSGEPRAVDGTPSFVAGDDTDIAPETLLYRDDLTVEIGRVPELIATLERLVGIGPAVCKVTATFGGDGGSTALPSASGRTCC